MGEPDSGDGYRGPAMLAVNGSRFSIQVELRGHFQPIDGRYHWYGRVGEHPELHGLLGEARAAAVLTTPEGSAPCELSDLDLWRRYRVTGVSTPPFATAMASPADPPDADLAAQADGAAAAAAAPRPEGAQPESPAAGTAAPAAAAAAAGGQPGALPGHVRVAVIGAGFGGIGAGYRLRQAGMTDFVILERAQAVGGTWRDNSYPGCTCDVPSHLYSFSFAPNPDWTRSFSRQAEIWQYLENVTDRYHLRRHVYFGADVIRADWDAGAARWQVRTSRGDLTADMLVSAAGPLSEPLLPDIPGLSSFPGPVFHSARWDSGADLAGKRVAVIGTGASAIQIVPAIQPTAGKLVLFQRTPAWVMPRRDHPISGTTKRLYRQVPATQQLARLGIYLSRESSVAGFVKRPWMLRLAQRAAQRHLTRAVPEDGLRQKLTPSYVMGCKRILLSNDFYPALTKPNTDVVAAGLAKIDGSTLFADDGTSHDVDALIFATGFRATDPPIAKRIHGAGGVSLADAWGGDMRALRGTTIHGFPNLCVVFGPNTGLGHTSVIHIIESQLNYILDYLATLDRTNAAALDALESAQDRWCAQIERRMEATVWSTGGCVSWYLNAAGRNPTLWPASTLRFRRELRRVDPSEYQIITGGRSA
jgi:cation diffusion facilitator CzcD-associated flavoprotein CzcO